MNKDLILDKGLAHLSGLDVCKFRCPDLEPCLCRDRLMAALKTVAKCNPPEGFLDETTP
jgi:hypothetical protein